MTRTIRLLALLLGAQLLLALGLHFTGPDLTATRAQTPLLEFDRERVDRVLVEGTDQAQVTLARSADAWTLPELGDFPADATRVAQLLARLAELKGGLPVATSAAAQPRFRVDDADFERRVTLFAGDDRLATLYLGSSPGMGQLHARAEGSDRIQVVELAAFDIPVQIDDWIDRLLISTPLDQIAAIEIDGLHIERAAAAGDGDQRSEPWQATGLAGGEQLDQQAVATLANRIAELSIGAVLGRESKPEYGLASPILDLKVIRTSGESVSYRIGKSADNQLYTLQSSLRPEYFRIPSYTAEQLLEAAARDALLASGTSEDIPPEAENPASPAPPES